MRIRMQENDHRKLNIVIPSVLVFNRVGAGFLPGIFSQAGIFITRSQAREMVTALNTYRRSHRGWVLVELYSGSGEHIEIKL